MTQNKNTAAAAQAAVITKGAPQNTNSSAQAAEINDLFQGYESIFLYIDKLPVLEKYWNLF